MTPLCKTTDPAEPPPTAAAHEFTYGSDFDGQSASIIKYKVRSPKTAGEIQYQILKVSQRLLC
jgi:hypothetical protein